MARGPHPPRSGCAAKAAQVSTLLFSVLSSSSPCPPVSEVHTPVTPLTPTCNTGCLGYSRVEANRPPRRTREAYAVMWQWMIGIGIVMALLAPASPAWAQAPAAPVPTSWGLYFKEIRKDDRIYVFNIPAEAERFEASGEMGRALTRPGAGPRARPSSATASGRCSSFTSSTASRRSFPIRSRRCSGSSGATARRESPPTSRTSRSRTASRCATRTRSRTTSVTSARAPADPGDSSGSFRIRRAKFKLEGWFWHRRAWRRRRDAAEAHLRVAAELAGGRTRATANSGAVARRRQHRLGSDRARGKFRVAVRPVQGRRSAGSS